MPVSTTLLTSFWVMKFWKNSKLKYFNKQGLSLGVLANKSLISPLDQSLMSSSGIKEAWITFLNQYRLAETIPFLLWRKDERPHCAVGYHDFNNMVFLGRFLFFVPFQPRWLQSWQNMITKLFCLCRIFLKSQKMHTIKVLNENAMAKLSLWLLLLCAKVFNL